MTSPSPIPSECATAGDCGSIDRDTTVLSETPPIVTSTAPEPGYTLAQVHSHSQHAYSALAAAQRGSTTTFPMRTASGGELVIDDTSAGTEPLGDDARSPDLNSPTAVVASPPPPPLPRREHSAHQQQHQNPIPDPVPRHTFGPNKSAISMLKALRFSPFVASRLTQQQQQAHETNVTRENHNAGRGIARGAVSPWEFFTPSMMQWYAIVSYIFSLMMFSCGVAALVSRYQEKPNTPIACDPRLDQALSWLAGLMLPACIFVPVWMAIFSEHVYPPLSVGSRVPIERTFRYFNHFVLYTTFIALFLLSIFGSSLYALSVAKSWDYVEHEACGPAFTTVRGIAIAAIAGIGLIAVGHSVHWAFLNSKLDDQRGIARPIPMEN